MTQKEICRMCDNYSTADKCEVRDTCKLMALFDENERLKKENKSLRAELEAERVRRRWEQFPDCMGK